MSEQRIVVAGATGHMGERIVRFLNQRGAKAVALTRATSKPDKVEVLKKLGAEIASSTPRASTASRRPCAGASCVVSALLGVRDTMVETQTVLLNGAVKAGVPRFIPSDYSLDYLPLKPDENRNLAWHREFLERLEKAPIKFTSVLNGAFMELLKGQAPLILFKRHRVIYWHDADQPLDFTTMNNTAEFHGRRRDGFADAEVSQGRRRANQRAPAGRDDEQDDGSALHAHLGRFRWAA